jgi:hypothetical protein
MNQTIVSGPLNVPFDGILNLDTNTGVITTLESESLSSQLNLSTGKMDIKDKNGILVAELVIPNAAAGTSLQVAKVKSFNLAAINAFVGAFVTVPALGARPINSALIGFLVKKNSPVINPGTPGLTADIGVGILTYGAPVTSANIISGKALQSVVVPEVSYQFVSFAGGVDSNLAPDTVNLILTGIVYPGAVPTPFAGGFTSGDFDVYGVFQEIATPAFLGSL